MLIHIGGYDEIVLEHYFVACTIDVSCSPRSGSVTTLRAVVHTNTP